MKRNVILILGKIGETRSQLASRRHNADVSAIVSYPKRVRRVLCSLFHNPSRIVPRTLTTQIYG